MWCVPTVAIVLLTVSVALSSTRFTISCKNVSKHKNYHLLPTRRFCGIVHAESRIMGGKDAVMGQFPWMAVLLTENAEGVTKMFCGGSVINQKYVLTAAHCLNYLKKSDKYLVRLGEHDMSTVTDCEESRCAPPVQNLRVEKIIKHERYDRNVRKEYDIALVRLKGRIVFNEFVKPICLPTDCSTMNNKFLGTTMKTCGWGNNLDNPSIQYTSILQTTSRRGVTLDACKEEYPEFKLWELQLCAGGSEVGEGVQDVCSGDSGGPLMFINDREGPPIHYVAVGLVSEGPNCEEGRSLTIPGVYTRVGAFVQWILDHIQE